MWKAVIADDEQVILNGLKKLVDWRALGVEIVGDALDGGTLLTQINAWEPDLVISDIKMPELTGLDVIKTCSTWDRGPKFIFVSGYEEFAFAKDAVRYGAVDYLLKPVAPEDLENAVKKAISQIEDKNTADIFREDKDELQQMFQKMNDGFEYAEEELYQRFEKENLSCEDRFYTGVCFSLIVDDQLKQQMSYEQMGLLRFSVYNKIAEQFRRRRLGFLIKKEEYFCDMMAILPLENRDDYVEALLLPICEQVSADMNVRLCMGIGMPVDSISLWKNSFKSAKFACELYYFDENPVIDFCKIQREYKISFDDFNQISEAVFQKIAARDASAIDSIRDALSAIESIHYGNRYAAVNRVLIFTGTLLEKLFVVDLVDGDFGQRQNEVQENIRYMNTYRELCHWLIPYYEGLIAEIEVRNKNKSSAEIMRVKKYIDEHYNEDLSLKELAEVACVSQHYFSSLFKKDPGEHYKSYVTKIRMEEAMRLVLKTDMKTYEIAEAVGYNNVRRFVDAFKGIYKISPMDYRKANS